jgi:hypothetical protein
VKEFRTRAAGDFGFLVDEFGFRQEPVPQGKNAFSVRYVNATTRVIVEGINWGANARVAFGSAGPPERFEDFDLLDLVSVLCPDQQPSGAALARTQLEQLEVLAKILRTCGGDVLRGDLSVAPQIHEIRRKRVEQWERDKAERRTKRTRG